MQFDWTINIPFVLTSVVLGAGLIYRFARIETAIETQAKTLEFIQQEQKAHEAKDDQRFATERADRHDLREEMDPRLRRVEVDLAKLQAVKGGS